MAPSAVRCEVFYAVTEVPTNLAETCIGRDAEIARLTELIASDSVRLVTVVGPPGIGKSCLVRHACARGSASEKPQIATFYNLADAREVEEALAIFGSASPPERVPLLVLDGFDHLVGEARILLGPCLEARRDVKAPPSTLIVTSRERLGLVGEHVLFVGPLRTDDAVELFVREARRVQPFDLDALSRPIVEELVERLDANPLAIILAGARIRTFPPAELLKRLDRRFSLLRPRHASESDAMSLERSIRTSWDLLNPIERDALRQCAVFRGSFGLDAAEAVVELEDADAPWVLDVVEALVEKSLLRRHPLQQPAGEVRLSMYESIRDFVAQDATFDAQPVHEAMRRHARHYLDLAESWLERPLDAAKLERAQLEFPNLLTVLTRFRDREPAWVSRAAIALDRVLRHLGQAARHRDVLDVGIEAAGSIEHADLAALHIARGDLSAVLGKLSESEADYHQALAAAGDEPTCLLATVRLAEVERRTGRAADGLRRLQALDVARLEPEQRRMVLAYRAACHVELGELDAARECAIHAPAAGRYSSPYEEYHVLKRLAYVHYYLGSYEQQHALNHDAMGIARRSGDRRREAQARQGLGDASYARGNFEAACEQYEAAHAVHRELGNRHLEAVLLGNLGAALHRIDRLERAARCYGESLSLHRQTGARPYEAVVTQALAVLHHEQGHLEDAAFQYEQALELFEELEQCDDAVSTLLCYGWLATERRDEASVEALLERAAQLADDAGLTSWQPLIELSYALHDARAGRTDAARARVAEVAWERFEHAPVQRKTLAMMRLLLCRDVADPALVRDEASRILQGRLLLRLEDALTAGEAASPVTEPVETVDLRVGEHGEWFEVPGEDVVNLRRRRAHRLILERLVELHDCEPGKALGVYDAFDLGWPGETATPEAAAERVYWVVGVLRRLGLDGILLTSDAGYYLDPARTISVVRT